jgi:ABC-type nickel/cobalt efflux system permease component RcnA
MFAAIRRGIPEIGLLWALAMAGGVLVTLAGTALVAVFARNAMLRFMAAHGHRMERLSRLAEAAAGLVLIVMASRELAI